MEVKQKIQKELDEVKKQLKKQRIFINNMKSSLNKKDKDNKMLEEEVNSLMEENSKLKGELEFERNQSFMSKLFRKKE
jgi:septal ring factor EnvC (AmiA/AmiB activator)